MKRKLLHVLSLLAGFCLISAAEELAVERAVLLAQSRMESVKRARGAVRRAGFGLTEARSRAFPRLRLDASASWMSNPPEGITVEAGALLPSPPNPFPVPSVDTVFVEDTGPYYYRISVVFEQPLFTWGKIKNAVDLAGLEVETARWELMAAERQTRRDVRNTYFIAKLAAESLPLLVEGEELIGQILQDQESSYEEGIVSWREVLSAKAQLAEMQRRVWEAREGYEVGLLYLAIVTGLEPEQIDLVSESRLLLPVLEPDTLIPEAISGSPERQVILLTQRKAQESHAIERGGSPLKPDLSLRIQWDLSGQDVPLAGEDWIDSWNQNLTVSLGTRASLFDSFESHWRSRQAEEDVGMAALGAEEFEKALALEVRGAVGDVRTAYYRLREGELRLDEVQELYKNAEVSFENELMTREEERKARVLLIGTKLEYLKILQEYESALVFLEYLTGRDL